MTRIKVGDGDYVSRIRVRNGKVVDTLFYYPQLYGGTYGKWSRPKSNSIEIYVYNDKYISVEVPGKPSRRATEEEITIFLNNIDHICDRIAGKEYIQKLMIERGYKIYNLYLEQGSYGQWIGGIEKIISPDNKTIRDTKETRLKIKEL